MNVAIIPARGGSKRIPRKNIKEFLGTPIIARSIGTALSSGCFDEVVVSTDDLEIADVARAHGASVPFVRPAELANDIAPTLPVVAHAVQWLLENGRALEFACCIYPTAPLLLPSDIRTGYELLASSDADYAISCCPFEFPVQRSVGIDEAGYIKAEFPEAIGARSQDLKPLFHDAGQFYWGRAQAYVEMRPFFAGKALPVMMPRLRVQDIDDEEDWTRAEFLLQWMKRESDDRH